MYNYAENEKRKSQSKIWNNSETDPKIGNWFGNEAWTKNEDQDKLI